MLKRGRDYRETYDGFRWEVPRLYNIAVDVCDRHAAGASRTALIYHDQKTDAVVEYSFRQLRGLSNRLANALAGLGIGRGDRVGIVLPQRPETAVAHLAAYKLGAIAVPMSCLFGPDALEYRLRHSGASLVVVDDDSPAQGRVDTGPAAVAAARRGRIFRQARRDPQIRRPAGARR